MEAPSTIKGTRSVQPDLTQQRKHSTEWEACGRGRIRRHVRPPTNTGRHLQPAPRRYLGRGFGRGLWCPIREQMIIGSERFSKRYQSPSRLVSFALQVIFSKRTAAENCPFHCPLCTLRLFSQSLATIFRSYRGRQREGLPAQPPVHVQAQSRLVPSTSHHFPK